MEPPGGFTAKTKLPDFRHARGHGRGADSGGAEAGLATEDKQFAAAQAGSRAARGGGSSERDSVENFIAAKLDGQPITATGEWAYSRETWRGLWSDGKLPDWGQAQGAIELDEAQVAAFASYLPEVLSPEGHG